MSDKISDEIYDTLPKKPNFLLVVVLAGAAILVVFAVVLFVLSDTGKRLLPGLHPDPHPTSYVLPIGSSRVNC